MDPLVYVELVLKISFGTDSDVITVEAMITRNSYVLVRMPNCVVVLPFTSGYAVGKKAILSLPLEGITHASKTRPLPDGGPLVAQLANSSRAFHEGRAVFRPDPFPYYGGR